MKAERVTKLYQGRADGYDHGLRLYKRFFFFDTERYRRIATERLKLTPGEVVLDIACGTGLNFPLLQAGIGPGGRIIGLDLSPHMLARAEERVRAAKWENVELVQGDATEATFGEVDAVLSTYAFCLIADPRKALRNAVDALKTGERMVLMDMQYSRHWQGILANPIAFLAALPYGSTMEMRRWNIKREMETVLEAVSFDEYYMGICYVGHGWKGNSRQGDTRPREVATHG